jgi:hypothetical protein
MVEYCLPSEGALALGTLWNIYGPLRQERMHLNGRLCIRDGSDAADRHSRRWTPTPPIPTRGEALNTPPAAAPRVPRVGVSKIINMWRAHESEPFLF